MAVLAPSEWPNMEQSKSEQSSAGGPPSPQQQQPNYLHINQQPHGQWTPSISAQPFYPSFYQNQHPQQPYFDPNAVWAYQQMMFNAQQHGFMPQRPPNGDYFSPFPSGTPPPNRDYAGFHPYRRPSRQNSDNSSSSDWRAPASASTSSVNSTNSQRQRTNSNNSGQNQPSAANRRSPRSTPSPKPTPTQNRPSALAPAQSVPTASASTSSVPRPARPSPLSQGNFTAAEKRMSRDDSDLAAMESSSQKNSGLKSRLRRALNFNPNQALKEDDDDDASIKASALPNNKLKAAATTAPLSPDVDDGGSSATVQTKKRSRAASLFNSRINASTDNISLSSTVSSASVMIRKLGSIGRLARRNSLAGITSLFKDKDKDDKKGKKDKKGGSKSEASEASVSHVTAELDRAGSDWSVGEMSGLSPAAKLARQHTLKSNAEAAAKAKAQQEAAAAATATATAAASKSTSENGSAGGVPVWERNTTTRQASPVKRAAGMHVNEDGTRVFIEEDDEEDQSDDAHYGRPQDGHHTGWDDDDDDWDAENDEDEDVTIRMQRTGIDDYQDEVEPWAMDVRRSVERSRKPAKGILKRAANYDQQAYIADQTMPARVRSNSYNSHSHQTELGPLARIPSPDPDHIDGLHRHGSHSSHSSNTAPSLPPLNFEASLASPLRITHDAGSSPSTPTSTNHPPPDRPVSSIFNHPNSSAPVLSTITNPPPTMTHRSATAPSKKLTFATNLSVYDTFSSATYDRRSEPATWSRLTPALAQRIKEELNSYKMEEMEVHAASRIHTQFFV